MHAVIVGCGRVGAELARELEGRGFTVSIIDSDEHAFAEKLHPGFHGKKVVGIGFDREVLEEAGIKDADVFASVTRGDNTNIVSSRIAREHYNVPNVAALIYDPRRAQIYERLGISTVAMVSWATDQVLARLLPASESVEWTVGSGEVVVVGVQAPEHLVGEKVSSLQEPEKVRLVAVTRFGESMVPTEDTIVQEGDFLHLGVLRQHLADLDARIQEPEVQ